MQTECVPASSTSVPICVRKPATQWDDRHSGIIVLILMLMLMLMLMGSVVSGRKRECSEREPMYLCP